jgi:hypothetical protein
MDRKTSGSQAQAGHTSSARRPANNRSAVSNGRLLPRGIDGRSAIGRRWKDLHLEFSALVPGPVTVVQDCRLRALVAVTVALEKAIERQVVGKTVDAGELASLTNAQGRLLRELTPQPAQKVERAPQTLDEYLAWKERQGKE